MPVFSKVGIVVVVGKSCIGGDFRQWLLVVAVVVWLGLELFWAVNFGFGMDSVV